MTTRPGSTVDETEDPNATTAVPTADETQDDDRKRIDDLATDKPEERTEPEPGELTEKPVAPKAKAEPEAKTPPSPIQQAIDRLATDAPAKPVPAAAEKPASGAPKTPGTAGQDAPPAKPTVGDPFADWTREERKHTKGTVKQRFTEMSNELEQYKKQAKESDPAILEIGKSWDSLLEKHQLDADVGALTPEQVAWTIKSQAAVVRTMQAVANGATPTAADLKILDTVRAGLSEVDRHLGREAPKGPSLDLDALEKLVKEASESLDLDAIQAFIATAKQQQAKPSAATAPAAKQPDQPAPVPRQQAERQQEPDHDRQLYANRFLAELAKRGVKPEQTVGWFNANVLPGLDRILRRDFPGQRPEAVYAKLSVALKHQMHMEALQEWEAGQKRSTPTPRQTTGPGERPLRTSGGGASAPPKPGSVLEAAINRLATDR